MHSDATEVEAPLVVSGPGDVTAKDIDLPAGVEILNPDVHIATLEKKTKLEMYMTIGRGRGYRPAEDNKSPDQPIGVIPIDSIFSPVRRVAYSVEGARVGQRTDYDRLILEIWTNGTISAEMAMVEAAKILRKHLNPFVQYFELGSELVSDEAMETLREAAKPVIDPDLEHKLNMTIQELDLSIRANNCLESAKLQMVRDLVQKTDADLLKVRSFGKTSLREVKRRLADLGLSLGMDVPNWPPENIEDLAKKFDDQI